MNLEGLVPFTNCYESPKLTPPPSNDELNEKNSEAVFVGGL